MSAGEFVTEGHLGGYVRGGDPATLYPDLWAWLVNIRGVKTVLDVGCGDGAALRAFRDLGCSVIGIDGVAQDDEDIIQHDFATGPLLEDVGDDYDLVWSCEVVEHVEERYLPNLLDSLTRGRLLLMTHAMPGQPGWHHVNCRTSDYWVGVMVTVGFHLDQELTRDTRALAAANLDPNNHYVRSGLAFRRET